MLHNVGTEQGLTSGQRVRNYIWERGPGGDYLFIALPQGKVNEESLFTHRDIEIIAFFFPFGVSENVPGNVGLCLEDGWNFR